MTIYTVRSEWDPEGAWVTTVPSVPGAVTQSRRLDLVPGDAAEVISLMTDTDVDPADIRIDWSIGTEAGEAAEAARSLRAQAEDAARRAEHVSAQAVQILRNEGFSYRDIGSMTGMSYQRAQQIARAS